MGVQWPGGRTGRVLTGLLVLVAVGCGGTRDDRGSVLLDVPEDAHEDTGEPASAGGPSVPRRSTDDPYPEAADPSGGRLRLEGDGCWYLDAVGQPLRMIVWPVDSELAPNGDAVEVPGSGVLVADGVVAADVAVLPAAELAGGPDGYWGHITGFCDDGGSDVVLIDSPTLLLDPAAPPPLTDDHPCGYGFTSSTPDQTVALIISPTTHDGPPAGGEVDLAGDDWAASLRVGLDLMAEWCDDAIEPDAPVPLVLAEWPVRTGLLVFDPGTGECGSTVTATLRGLVVDAPLPIELPDTTVTNTAYGCFAG